MSGQPIEFVPTLPPEEAARADLYGVLARLFYAAPDAALLEAIAGAGAAEAEQGNLAASWRALAAAAARADPEALRAEYDMAFVGTGKAPVSLYAGGYLARFTNEVPLAALRAELAALGLARSVEANEPEDHFAALCDAMRHLVAGQKRDLAEQRRFFNRWMGPASDPLCDAIINSSSTDFYKHVGRFAKSFFALEQAAFEML